MKNRLDEMQEQKLLKIEHNGCWLAFYGLAAVIMIQLFLCQSHQARCKYNQKNNNSACGGSPQQIMFMIFETASADDVPIDAAHAWYGEHSNRRRRNNG